MEIIGLQSGMVIQRDATNHADSYFTVVDAPDAVVSVDLGAVTEMDSVGNCRRFHLIEIVTGGPYTLKVTVGIETAVFTDVYVGDVWVLGGQSNMSGCGAINKTFDDYVPCESIRFYSVDGKWKTGEPRLYQTCVSQDEHLRRMGYTGYWEPRGVGPGYAFAKSMRERTGGVPQGLICCAVGGSELSQWDPDTPREPNPNLYGKMLKKYTECGGNARGMFWHQGCAETFKSDDAEHFTERMVHFIESFRRDFARPDMAFVQVQIYRYAAADPETDVLWRQVREAQRTLHEHVANMDTIAATNAELSDMIHLQGNTQMVLGTHAAESMYYLCFDPYGMTSTPAPQLDTIYPVHRTNDVGAALAIKYKNLNGRLTSEGRPTGYAISMSPDKQDKRHIFRVDLHNDTAYVRYELPYEQMKNAYLFYMFGNDTYANITDEDGRPLPAMGPIALKEYLE